MKSTEKASKMDEKISSQKKDDATRMDEDEVDDDSFYSTEPTTKKGNSKPKVSDNFYFILYLGKRYEIDCEGVKNEREGIKPEERCCIY